MLYNTIVPLATDIESTKIWYKEKFDKKYLHQNTLGNLNDVTYTL